MQKSGIKIPKFYKFKDLSYLSNPQNPYINNDSNSTVLLLKIVPYDCFDQYKCCFIKYFTKEIIEWAVKQAGQSNRI